MYLQGRASASPHQLRTVATLTAGRGAEQRCGGNERCVLLLTRMRELKQMRRLRWISESQFELRMHNITSELRPEMAATSIVQHDDAGRQSRHIRWAAKTVYVILCNTDYFGWCVKK